MTTPTCRDSARPTIFRPVLLHRIATLLLASALYATSIPSAACEENNGEKSVPNIVLILADDMGYECVGANGCLDYRTPNLDALAAEGMRFEHCYAQPLCTPSRVKLMTGMSNKRNYVQFGLLDRGQTTFAHLFKDAGYRTCVAGKWQLGHEPDSPQHFGFEESLLWQHTRGRTDAEQHDTGIPIHGWNATASRWTSQRRVFDGCVRRLHQPVHGDKSGSAVLRLLSDGAGPLPFSPTPDSDNWDPKSLGSQTYKGNPEYFADMVAYTDKAVGRIDARLKELGLRDNTLVIFTGDNGTDKPIVTRTTFGPIAGAKGSMIDGGTRVPCIVRWPGVIPHGRVCKDIVDFSDFLPTLCEAAGVKVPANLNLDGQSFLPQLAASRARRATRSTCGTRDPEVRRRQRHSRGTSDSNSMRTADSSTSRTIAWRKTP